MNRATLVVGTIAVVLLTACDADANTSTDEPTTTVEIVMTDMAYTPKALNVSAGETITLTFRNDGSVRHEALFGDHDEQLAHHAEMATGAGADHATDDMEHMDMSDDLTDSHGGMDAIVLEPGQTITVNHTFDNVGQTMIGCHEPGHWEAGMKLDVNVT